VEAWCTHIRTLILQAFGAQDKAAAALGKSTSWLSRGLNARHSDSSTRMPNREFVDTVLAACTISDEVRDRTRALYMEALAAVDKPRYAQYRAADQAAAAQDRCDKAVRALAELQARIKQQEEQHAREVARLEGELRRQEREGAAALAAAQSKISELAGQLAAERQERRVDQATIRALRQELLEAHSTVTALREQPCHHEREQAVLADAIAITEQALAAEEQRAEADGTALAAVSGGRKKPAGGPAAISAVDFVVMTVGALVGLAAIMHPDVAADLTWDLVNALRGNPVAGVAGLVAFVLGFSAWLGGMMALVDRGYIQTRDHLSGTSAEPSFATWI
jgi:rubrerythrin